MSALHALAADLGYRLVTSPVLVGGVRVAPQPDCGPLEWRARRLLEPHGLSYQVIGDTLVVYRPQERETKAPAENPERERLAEVVVVGRSFDRGGAETGIGSSYGNYRGGADAVIDFDRINALGITDLGSALALISGVKMEQQRYAVIRGMAGRYQSVRLNGAVIPSLEPSTQRVPMDIFPVNILNHVDLRKSVFADAPGNASAGVVNIETRRIPEENSLTLVSGGGYRSGTTGAEVIRGYVGDRDWLGYDDGGRDLPQAIADGARLGRPQDWPAAQREAAGEAVPRAYGLYNGEAGADGFFSLSGGRYWQRDSHSWGVSASLGYRNQWRQLDLHSQVLNRRVVEPDGEGGERDIIFATEDSTHRRLDNLINTNALLALGYGLEGGHHLGANFLLLRQSNNHTEQIESREYNALGDTDGGGALRSLFNWTEMQMALRQLYGSHFVGPEENIAVDWHLTSARSGYSRPYDVSYRYLRNSVSSSYTFDPGYGGFRVGWEDMREDTLSAGLNVSYRWLGADWSGEVEAGLEALGARQDGYLLGYTFIAKGDIDADRELMERNNPGDILTPETILGEPGSDGFLLENTLNLILSPPELDGDFYAAEHRNRAGYLLADTHYGDRWQFLLGMRREGDSVKADFWDAQPQAWVPLLDDRRNLYSAAVNFSPFDGHDLRLGYSQTVAWPSVNELMPRRYEDIDLRIEVTGNPHLAVAAAENWDLRWQFDDEDRGLQAKLLGFYKRIDNAIEGVFFDPVIEGNRTFDIYTYVNTDAATLYGYELELDYEKIFAGSHKLELKSSYSNMFSEVEIPPELEPGGQRRPLQGQPDYLGSLQLQYRHLESDRSVSLLYKRAGEELFIVSNTYKVPPVYRNTHDSLALTWNWRIMPGVHGTLVVDNLLDDEHRYTQGGQTYLFYREGRKYELRLAVDF